MNEAAPPLDRAHLDAVTDGDRTLQKEVLAIFFAQVPLYILAVREARHDDGQWRSAVHRLKGAARSIGAVPLARAGGEAELALPRERAACIVALESEIARLETMIAGIPELAAAPGESAPEIHPES